MDQETIAGFLGLFGELLAPDAGTTDLSEPSRQDSEQLENLIQLIIQTTKNPDFKERLSSLDSEIQSVFEAIAAVASDPESVEVTELTEGIVVLSSIMDAIAEARIGGTSKASAPLPAPARHEVEEYTQHFVKQAIQRYESEGLEATVAHYNTRESIDGQWYVFIFDQDDIMLAHAPNPDLVDKPASYATGPNGYPVGEAVVAAADEDGEWFRYTYPNPATGGLETKHSWMVERDGLTFGSGWYERGPSRSENPVYTQAFVQQAINLYNAVGLEETVTYYNTPESIDGQWYIFIYDIDDDSLLTHAAIPDLIGKPASAAVGPNNYPAGEAVFAVADEDGEWFSYSYTNPNTGAAERKHSWMVEYDGLVFGSGWYEPGPRKSDNPAYTRDFVERAVGLYEAVGRDATVAYYKTKESVDGQWYVFIIDEDGYTISHHNEMFLGRDPALRVDSTGYFYGDDLLSATESGRWVDYVLLNPETGDERQKHTWAVRHDGLIFASGWYE